MIREMQSLLDDYWKWLKDQTSLRAVDDWIEITTPYLDRHNDCIQIYARGSEHGYRLTDDGYVLEDLEQSGCTIDHPRYRTLVDTAINGFGVRVSEGALEVEAARATFGVRKHNLLQAMMAVEDISYIAKPSDAERPPFLDVVSRWAGRIEGSVHAEREPHGPQRLRSPIRVCNPEVGSETGAGRARLQQAEPHGGDEHGLLVGRHEASQVGRFDRLRHP